MNHQGHEEGRSHGSTRIFTDKNQEEKSAEVREFAQAAKKWNVCITDTPRSLAS
jgi:hypothetical protein